MTQKLPKNPAEAADMLYTVREKRYALDKQSAALKAQESALQAHILEVLAEKGMTGVAGKVCRVEASNKTVPTVDDWVEFWAKFNKKSDFDLLQARLSTTAVQARWDAGKQVPGVKAYLVPTLSIKKA